MGELRLTAAGRVKSRVDAFFNSHSKLPTDFERSSLITSYFPAAS
jgi:hypothetical protein